MKNLLFFTILLLTSLLTSAQEIDQCRKIVKMAIESINNKSSENLNTSLAEDFTIAGQNGNIAKIVLNQLLSQLNDTVLSYEEKSQTNFDKVLELKYTIDYKTRGIKEATFIFNENNLLKELVLFKMEVKMFSQKSEITKSSKNVVKIPFSMAGKLISVDIMLNGIQRKFILDTGAPRVVLNSRYIISDSTLTTISSTKGINGNISGMDIKKLKSLNFGGIRIENQEVIAIDLSHLEEELGYEFYGLIGYDLIKDYDILFDYRNHTITLINPEFFETFKNENLIKSKLQKIPFILEGHIPVVKAKIKDSILNFGIDCGAESNIIDDDLLPILKNHLYKLKTDDLIGADNNKVNANNGEIKKMTIGNIKFKNVSTYFSDISHLNKSYNLSVNGLIGYPILHKQKTLISYRRKELIFIR